MVGEHGVRSASQETLPLTAADDFLDAPGYFGFIMSAWLFLNPDQRVPQRAAWLLNGLGRF